MRRGNRLDAILDLGGERLRARITTQGLRSSWPTVLPSQPCSHAWRRPVARVAAARCQLFNAASEGRSTLNNALSPPPILARRQHSQDAVGSRRRGGECNQIHSVYNEEDANGFTGDKCQVAHKTFRSAALLHD